MSPLPYFAALNRLTKLTSLRFAKLLTHFQNDAERIWKADRHVWVTAGIEPRAIDELWAEKATIDPAVEYSRLEKLGATVLPITDPTYPALLKTIYAPPPVLLVRGTFPIAADDAAVAIVGSRVTSAYGRQATTELTCALATAGVSIVSGLAAGVDALAHQAALGVGGRTVAVLGCGIDRIYPPTNRRLADEILSCGGAIISEYPIGTEPAAYLFPQRNRIIAGLSRGTLVTEAREKSGSLITAELALEYGREVFAVPGSIFAESSCGTNCLIASGARLIASAHDILDALNLETRATTQPALSFAVGASDEESRILTALTKESQHVDEIARAIGLTASTTSATLSLLEVRGLARNLGGMTWVRG